MSDFPKEIEFTDEELDLVEKALDVMSERYDERVSTVDKLKQRLVEFHDNNYSTFIVSKEEILFLEIGMKRKVTEASTTPKKIEEAKKNWMPGADTGRLRLDLPENTQDCISYAGEVRDIFDEKRVDLKHLMKKIDFIWSGMMIDSRKECKNLEWVLKEFLGVIKERDEEGDYEWPGNWKHFENKEDFRKCIEILNGLLLRINPQDEVDYSDIDWSDIFGDWWVFGDALRYTKEDFDQKWKDKNS